MSESNHGHHGQGGRDYEDRDIPLGIIIKSCVGIAVFTALTFWGAKLMLQKLTHQADALDQPVSQFAQERVLPPEPHLLVDEKRTLEEQQAVEHRELTTYAWIDKNAGAVRIPVDRAIDIIAERGLPARATK